MSERIAWVLAEIRKTEADLAAKLAEIKEQQASGVSIGSGWQQADHLAKYMVALHNELAALQAGVDDPANRSATETARSDVQADSGNGGGFGRWVAAAVAAIGIGGIVWAIRRKK